MESNLQEEYLRDTADANKLKANAMIHLSKASLLFREMGKTKEALVVNNIIKLAKSDKKSNKSEMKQFFEWLGFESGDLDFCGEDMGQMAEDVQWPDAEEIREHIEGGERDPRAQRNYKRDDILKALYNMQSFGEENDRLKNALKTGTMLVIRSAEAEQELDEEKAQLYLSKAEELISKLNEIMPSN